MSKFGSVSRAARFLLSPTRRIPSAIKRTRTPRLAASKTRWKSKCVQPGLDSAEVIWKNGLISGDL